MKLLVCILTSLFFFNEVIGQTKPLRGQWQGVVEYEQETVPFEFKVEYENDKILITIINGKEKIKIEEVTISGDSMVIPLKPFDAEIRAKYDEHTMEGLWKKGYKKKTIPFHATYGKPRFEGGAKKKKLSYKWRLEFERGENDTYPAVGLFQFTQGVATGSILTEVGDFRYFEGIIRNDSLLMSSFDGAHGFKIAFRLSDDKLSGLFHMDDGYFEKVMGYVDEDAEIVSPFKMIESKHRPYFDILSAGNPSLKIDQSLYFDKVLVLQLFGTWCPNSMDQTNFLTEWYKIKPDNVEVLAVTYEPNFSIEYGMQRIEAYKENMNIPYEMSLGGELSKGQAALALPYLEKINAFPTVVLIDKYGFIRFQFDYFNGPATGKNHKKFKEDFLLAVNTLANEK